MGRKAASFRKSVSLAGRKCVLATVVAVLVVAMGGSASADLWNGVDYDFVDVIDTWGSSGADTAWIGQNDPLSYEHDITAYDVPANFWVTEAWLSLEFTDDWLDNHGSFLMLEWDFREYVSVGHEDGTWTEIGEVDNGQYDVVVDVDWLNDDGVLDVTLNVTNPAGNATASLDTSALYGNLESHAPIPAAAVLGMLGLVTAGLTLRKYT